VIDHAAVHDAMLPPIIRNFIQLFWIDLEVPRVRDKIRGKPDPGFAVPGKAVESLREKGIPIFSTSGKAGYKLETDPEKIAEMLDEMKSRIAHLNQKVQAIQTFSNTSRQ
jgi:hypothetical protein